MCVCWCCLFWLVWWCWWCNLSRRLRCGWKFVCWCFICFIWFCSGIVCLMKFVRLVGRIMLWLNSNCRLVCVVWWCYCVIGMVMWLLCWVWICKLVKKLLSMFCSVCCRCFRILCCWLCVCFRLWFIFGVLSVVFWYIYGFGKIFELYVICIILCDYWMNLFGYCLCFVLVVDYVVLCV